VKSTDINERRQTEIQLKEKSDEIEVQNEELQQIIEQLQYSKEQIEESEEAYRILFDRINDASFLSIKYN